MRRAVKFSIWSLAGLLLVLVLGVAIVLIGGNTAGGRAFIERGVARLTDGKVLLTGLAGSFPAALTLKELRLIDAQGVWLSVEDLALRWSPLDLVAGRIHVDDLKASRLHMERMPVSQPASGGSVTIPHVDVMRLAVDTVELGAPLAGVPVALSLRGSGWLHSLQRASADLEAHRVGGDGDYRLRIRLDPRRIDASLALREPAGGPLEHMLKMPGLGALTADATVEGPRSAEQIKLTLAAGELHAGAQGRVDLVKNAADLDFSLHAPALALRPDLAWRAFDLEGSWHGPFASAIARASLTVEELEAPGGVRLAQAAANLVADGGPLKFKASLNGLRIPGPQPLLLAADPLTLNAVVDLRAPGLPVDVDAGHRLFQLHVKAITRGDRHAALDLRIPEIAPWAQLAGQDAQGTAEARAEVGYADAGLSTKFQATLNFTGGSAEWVPMVSPRVALQLDGTLSATSVKIERLRIATPAAVLSANGTAKRRGTADAPIASGGFLETLKDLKAQWEADFSDLHAFTPDAAGTAKATGQLSGDWPLLASDTKLASTVSVRGAPSGEIAAEIHARGIPNAPSGSLQAHGDLDDAPLKIDVAMERAAGRTAHILVRQAQWKSARVAGDLTLGAALSQARGNLELRFADLRDLDRLSGVNLEGSLDGAASFAPGNGTSQVQLRFAAKDLVLGQIAGGLQLTASGPSNALDVALTAQFPELYGAAAKFTSAATLNSDAHELRLAEAAAEYTGLTFKLLSPAVIAYGNGVTVDQLRFGAQGAVVELKGRLTPTLDLNASLAQVKPDLINAFAPGLLAGGLIEGQASLQGSLGSPQGRVQFDATTLRFADDAAIGVPPLELHAKAKLAGGSASVEARLGAGSGSSLTASGTVPLAGNVPLDVKLTGKLDMGLANPMLEARGLRAAGALDIDAAVTGTGAAPQFAGTLSLARGNLRDYGRGINLSDISAELAGSDGTLQIKSFKAVAGSGSLVMTGSLGVLQANLPVNLDIIAKNAQPVASSIVTGRFDGDLKVTGTARQRLDVAGKIHVNRATITIPNSFPPDVAVLDVRRRGKAVPPPPSSPLVVGVDVVVEAPQQILVQGRGLDAELGGDVHITGTTDALQVNGGFDLQRGTFTLAGSKLDFIQPGKVSFDGAGLRKKIDPTLDFTAQTTVGDTTATLHISGVADAPQFDFSSSPTLPQDEILALVLFGVPAAQLTAIQVAEIGAALATLSGVGGNGPNPLVRLQKSLGLDRLSVGSNTTTTATGATENSGASIAAGRYISRRVYIEGKQTTTGTSQVTVDVDLTKRLKLQTSLGNGTAIQGTTPENDPGSSVGLKYQFEY